MMMIGPRPAGLLEGLGGAVAVTALGHDADDVLGQAGQDARHGLLGHVLRPVAVDGADDLELRELRDALVDALADLLVDRGPGEAPDLEQLAALGQLVGQEDELLVAHVHEVDADAVGAIGGDDAVERDDRDALRAGLLDDAVERLGVGGVDRRWRCSPRGSCR